jgi:hypothetical protein
VRRKGQYVFFDIHAWEKKMFQGGQHTTGAAAGDGDADLAGGMDESAPHMLGSHS